MYMPLDVLNKKFKKSFTGYSTEEVDEFKEDIATDYEKLYKENIELKDKLDILNKALQHYKSMENALQNTLLIAQKTSEDIKSTAYQRADVIKKEGAVEAEVLVSNAKYEVEKLKQEYDFIKREYENFRIKFRSMLCSEMQFLDESLNIANERIQPIPKKKDEEQKEENIQENIEAVEDVKDIENLEIENIPTEDSEENLNLQET